MTGGLAITLPRSRTSVARSDVSGLPVRRPYVRAPSSLCRSLGKFQLFGIPPAARGVPQIQVTFAIDASGVMTVSALDLASKATKAITIEGALGRALDKAAVDKVLRDTDAAKSEDEQRRAWSAARVQLDTLLYSTRALLSSSGAQLTPASRKRAEEAVTRADAVYAASTTRGDPAPILAAHAALQKTVFAVTEELYRTVK